MWCGQLTGRSSSSSPSSNFIGGYMYLGVGKGGGWGRGEILVGGGLFKKKKKKINTVLLKNITIKTPCVLYTLYHFMIAILYYNHHTYLVIIHKRMLCAIASSEVYTCTTA